MQLKYAPNSFLSYDVSIINNTVTHKTTTQISSNIPVVPHRANKHPVPKVPLCTPNLLKFTCENDLL